LSTIIEDGTGTANKAKVSDENRLFVQAITEPEVDHAAQLGNKFNLNTGNITLTNDSKTTVIYVKNNETNDLFVTALVYNLGNPTTAGNATITWVRNPNSGDIIDNTNAVAINSNQNFGSAVTLEVDAYVGASAETAATATGTGDGDSGVSISPGGSGRILVSLGALVLPKGKSISIDYTPPSGNTSQVCNFAIVCFKQTQES
jgi:hypothetical protein